MNIDVVQAALAARGYDVHEDEDVDGFAVDFAAVGRAVVVVQDEDAIIVWPVWFDRQLAAHGWIVPLVMRIDDPDLLPKIIDKLEKCK